MNPDNSLNQLTLGVDTHLDVHVAVLLNGIGKLISTQEFEVSHHGYKLLLRWASSFGTVISAGLEGTGTYGAGLCSYLLENGISVFEVNRPNRLKRRLKGKSDPTDAENAARSVLANESQAIPKKHDGVVEALRYLLVARRSAVKARTQAINQIRALLVTAPHEVREGYLVPSTTKCISLCSNIISLGDSTRLETLSSMLRLLAMRWLNLTEELKLIEKQLKKLTKTSASQLISRYGVGPYVAATLLVTAGDNPERLRKESSFAALCGTNPVDASSGKKQRHRLNRGGSREANNALWTVALIRMRSDARTRQYTEKRTAEGLTTKEIQRCLKRYIARELFPIILSDLDNFRYKLT
jgi:transposase